MATKLISDIRLFESNVPNRNGNPVPSYIGQIYRYDTMDCLDVIQRLLFLLRHRGFGFEGFDHLYLNFTPCVPHGEVREVDRSQIREFSWYQYVDAGCDAEIFHGFSRDEKTSFILESARKAAKMKAPEGQEELFDATFDEVLRNGEHLLIPYRQKENQSYTAEVFTRITDDVSFIPLLRVTDKNGVCVAEQELRPYGRDEFICQIGTITMGKSSLRITPRKSAYAEYFDLTPIKLEW